MIISDFPYSYPNKTNFNKYCTNCGTPNNKYRYCPNCGTPHFTDEFPTTLIGTLQNTINKPRGPRV